MDTLDFLYHWKFDSCKPKHCLDWAEYLITHGHETNNIIELLGNSDMNWDVRNNYVHRILKELNIDIDTVPDEAIFLYYEKILISQFISGELTPTELIQSAYHGITLASDYKCGYSEWSQLDDAFCQGKLWKESYTYGYFLHDGIDLSCPEGALRKLLHRDGLMDFLDDPNWKENAQREILGI